MRRLVKSLMFAALASAAAPTPAHAWFGWLDELSGPTLKGFQIEVRLMCFGERIDKRILPDRRSLLDADGRVSLCDREKDAERRWSWDAGSRFYWSRFDQASSEEFAGGNTLRFTTLTTGLTFRPLVTRQSADIVDLGFGGGVYWLGSGQRHDGGIASFHGALLEARAEFHLPTRFRGQSRWYYLVPSLRLAELYFPAGFQQNAFGPDLVNEKARAIGPEGVPEVSVFWDFGVLLR